MVELNVNQIIIIPDINIYEFPRSIPSKLKTQAGDQITIGDLHGNVIKLIHFLVMHGVMDVTSSNYNRLVNIYRKDIYKMTSKDVQNFQKILTHSLIHHDVHVHLLGDELADRGNCDIFMLFMFEAMQKQGLPFDITFSNHGLSFLCAYQNFFDEVNKNLLELDHMQARSCFNLKILIDRGIVSVERTIQLVETTYKPALVAITYSISPNHNKLKVYSHAPIDLDIIENLAQHFGITYKEDKITDLTNVIDNINQIFKADLQANRLLLHSDFDPEILMQNYRNLGRGQIQNQHPLLAITWNRGEADPLKKSEGKQFIRLQPKTKKFTIENFVHGHEGPLNQVLDDDKRMLVDANPESWQTGMINLDNLTGREDVVGEVKRPLISLKTKDTSPIAREIPAQEPDLHLMQQMYSKNNCLAEIRRIESLLATKTLTDEQKNSLIQKLELLSELIE